jgi:hypothetical protein
MASRTHGPGGASGQEMGLGLIYQLLIGQGAALSFIDTYVVLGTASAAMFFMSFLLKSNDPEHTEVHTGH